MNQIKSLFKLIAISSKPVLYIFDFDGTLTELVEDPATAILKPERIDLLNQLSEFTNIKLAILSGRDLKTLKSLSLNKLNFNIILIGSHGAEFSQEATSNPARDQIDFFLSEVKKLEDFPLLDLEYKTLAIGVHYKRHPTPQDLVKKLYDIVQNIEGIRVQEGYAVFEVLPIDANKSNAIRILHETFPEHLLVCFGDDLTDDIAFQIINELQGLSIQVAQRFKSKAKYFIDSVEELYQFLNLINLNSKSELRK